MQRRTLLIALAGWPAGAAFAHHGWSSFDQGRPLYLEGVARKVAWRNPHVEFDLEVAPDMKVPPDLARRAVPAQSAAVDGPRLLAGARAPTRKDKVWRIELAPLTRMEAWKVAPIRDGDRVSVVGFTFAEEKGEPVLRVEYLFVGAQAFGLRSAPA
ncbi:MAG TPA: DUF6152 family protein [Burkholderiaceae bacterium]|nr:DUF6152 family protein [Burkholderiaceae bacterium]